MDQTIAELLHEINQGVEDGGDRAEMIASQSSMVNESLEDTMRDLAGYAILWLGAEE